MVQNKKSKRSGDKVKSAFWIQKLDEWDKSGLSQLKFCKQHNLKHHQFLYWKKRIRGSNPAPVKLIQLSPQPIRKSSVVQQNVHNSDPQYSYSVGFTKGYSISLREDFSSAEFIRLIQVMERICP